MMSASIAAQAMAISAALPEATGPNERLAGMSLYIRKVYAALPDPPDSMTRPEIIAATDGLCADGYWCVACGRFLPADECGVIVHDNVPHPEDMTFDEEERPQ